MDSSDPFYDWLLGPVDSYYSAGESGFGAGAGPGASASNFFSGVDLNNMSDEEILNFLLGDVGFGPSEDPLAPYSDPYASGYTPPNEFDFSGDYSFGDPLAGYSDPYAGGYTPANDFSGDYSFGG